MFVVFIRIVAVNDMLAQKDGRISITEILEQRCSQGLGQVRMFIEGAPGVGKSTFTQKLVWEWAMETPCIHHLSEYKLVLLIPANKIKYQSTFIDYLCDELLPANMKSHLITLLDDVDIQKHTLFIIDGYDELKSNCVDSLQRLLNGPQYIHCSIMVTSRPGQLSNIEQLFDYTHRFLIAGLQVEKLDEFMGKILEPSMITAIGKQVKQSPLATNPLCFGLICIAYQSKDKI